jgi:hypothetical protein
MESEVLKMSISQGIWCALFVFLFVWTLNSNSKREAGYQDIIKTLADDIKEKLKDIENKMQGE